MFESIGKYLRYTLLTPFKRDARKLVGKDLLRKRKLNEVNEERKRQALEHAIDWLLEAQRNMRDDGFGSYHLIDGWSSSYPETSGYILPTLLRYNEKNKRAEIDSACIDCANWLLKIQKQSGGWQSMTVGAGRPEVVFNTGQVLRGLYAVFLKTADTKYLNACSKAVQWLHDIQEEDGAWRKHAFMGVERVYDSYVDAPILLVNQSLSNDDFEACARRNLDWIVDNKQLENGWFLDCDNTIHRNDRPILHTIAYTVDGLLDSADYLKDDRYFDSGKLAADRLLDEFETKGWLYGRYDRNWVGSEHPLLTGWAQISICWLKIFRKTGDRKYLLAASRMNSLLVSAQIRTAGGSGGIAGALTGSWPVWGRYEKFACPNWATKYFADALMLEFELGESYG